MSETEHERLGISFGMRSAADLAAQVKRFAERHEPARERWEYCLNWLQRRTRQPAGEDRVTLSEDGLASAARFLGLSQSSARTRMQLLHRMGFELAEARLTKYGARGLYVGPMEPWQVGHVYFARPKSAPHIFKVGFSRRVAERLDDIGRRIGDPMQVHILRVGTMLDERWWHSNWASDRIAGEWFFDPFQDDRTIPGFLADALSLPSGAAAAEGEGVDAPGSLATIEHRGSIGA